MTALVVVEAVVLALLALLVAGLLRSHAEILRSLADLGIDLENVDLENVDLENVDPDNIDVGGTDLSGAARGRSVAPDRARVAVDVSGVTPSGDAVAVGVHGAPRQVLLAFLSTGCSTCRAFWDGLAGSGADGLPGDLRVAVVTGGPDRESPAAVAALVPDGVAVVMSSAAWADYDVPGAPYFVHVDGPTGRIVGDGTARTWPQLVGLVEDALGDQAASGSRTRRERGEQAARRRAGGAGREARADAALAAAGIGPGHPSLYGPITDPITGAAGEVVER